MSEYTLSKRNCQTKESGRQAPILFRETKMCTDWNGGAVPICTHFCFSEKDWSLPPAFFWEKQQMGMDWKGSAFPIHAHLLLLPKVVELASRFIERVLML
jgi:hypothetical protein